MERLSGLLQLVHK